MPDKPTLPIVDRPQLSPTQFAGTTAQSLGGLVRAYAPTGPAADASSVLSAHLLHGDGPADAQGNAAPLPVTRQGLRARAQARRALLSQGSALVARLQAAHAAGAITPGDLLVLQGLLGWVSALAAEEDAAKRQK